MRSLKENFSERWMTFYDPDNFDPVRAFQIYNGRYEMYNLEKDYAKEPFVGVDGRTYQNVLHCLHPAKSMDGPEMRYVVQHEIISEEELKRLQPHCQCPIHRMSWWQPAKYLTCPCCVGCLDCGIDFASPSVIKKTREFVDAPDSNLLTNWTQYW